MSDLSEFRASIQRVIKADDTIKAFKDEGFSDSAAALTTKSKSFRAARSVTASNKAITKP